MDSKATLAPNSPSPSWRARWRVSVWSSLATHTVVIVVAAVVLLALSVPLLPPRFPHAIREIFDQTQHWRVSPPSVTLRNPLVFEEPKTCPKSVQHVEFKGTFHTKPERSMALADQAKRVAAEFDFGKDAVNKAVQEFLREMGKRGERAYPYRTLTARRRGPAERGHRAEPDPHLRYCGSQWHRKGTSMLTEYGLSTLTDIQGLYMAVDLGGTNFRVCSIQLHGNTTFSLTQSKVAIPRELMVAKTSKELFSFLAKQIELFLKAHHEEHYAGTIRRQQKGGGEIADEEIFNLGFTFSFPVNQIGINKGMLMRWTKGFDIQDAVGKDVCALLQNEIDELHLPVKVAALVNDTVGTLMARSYTSPGKTGTLLGAIFGTGTNGAYVEKLAKVSKLTKDVSAGEYDKSTGEMIVNTEWGSFDNSLRTLPNTPYDIELDAKSVNPGIQMFEKRVSGMFLGELLRLALVRLIKDPAVPLFADDNSSSNDQHSTTQIHDSSPIWKQWGIDTSFLSVCAGDSSAGFRMLRQTLDKDYDISAVSAEDAEAVREISGAIGRRAARLAAVAIAGVIIQTGRLSTATGTATTEQKSGINPSRGEVEVADEDMIDIGVDGSLVEFYPNFEEHIREALREVAEIGSKGEQRVRIGIAKDGSGVGAALIALVAGNVASPTQ
jgi:hexokinase